MTQRTLADALNVSPRTITGLIDGLAGTGFVTRQPHPTRRRAILVTFTEKGTRTAEAMAREQGELARLLFARMPQRRLSCLIECLDEMLTRLREHGLSYEVPSGGAVTVRRMVSHELAMWRSLCRWVFRRPLVPGAGARAFSSAGAATPIYWVFIAAA